MTNEEAIKILKEVREEVLAKETELSKQVFENLGIKAIDLAIKALEQQPCKDWYDVPSDEMTLEQARQAVKDLRKKLAEYLEQQTSDGIEVIRMGKNTVKARQGRFVVYDVEWLKEHFNTTETMLYGVPSEDYTSKESVIEWLKDKDIIKTKNQEENARIGHMGQAKSMMMKTEKSSIKNTLKCGMNALMSTDNLQSG